jgi:hypothetical protein
MISPLGSMTNLEIVTSSATGKQQELESRSSEVQLRRKGVNVQVKK